MTFLSSMLAETKLTVNKVLFNLNSVSIKYIQKNHLQTNIYFNDLLGRLTFCQPALCPVYVLLASFCHIFVPHCNYLWVVHLLYVLSFLTCVCLFPYLFFMFFPND